MLSNKEEDLWTDSVCAACNRKDCYGTCEEYNYPEQWYVPIPKRTNGVGGSKQLKGYPPSPKD